MRKNRHARRIMMRAPYYYVSDPPLPQVTPAIYWISGDGGTPTVGPALTTHGTPTTGQHTPWQDITLQGIDACAFDGTSDYYDSAANVDPGLTDDIRVTVLCRVPDDVTINDVICGTRSSVGRGWSFRIVGGSRVILEVEGNVRVESSPVDIIPGGWHLLDGFVDRDGDIVLTANGKTTAGVGCPAGSLASGVGIGIGGRENGTNLWSGDIAWVRVEYGGTWVPATDCDLMSRAVLGWGLATGGGTPTFARNSVASAVIDGVYHIFSANMPICGHDDGYIADPLINLKIYNNINPQNTIGWTATGGAFTVQNDAAALLGAGLKNAGPNVFEFTNASGVTQYVYNTPNSGNNNYHTLSLFARLVAGTADVGWWDVSAGSYVNVGAIGDNYTRTIWGKQLPGDTDRRFCIRLPNNATIRFTLPVLEERRWASNPIPNWNTGAIYQRTQDFLNLSVMPPDAKCGIEAFMRNNNWTYESPFNVGYFIASGGTGYYCYQTNGGWATFITSGGFSASISMGMTSTRRLIRVGWGHLIYLYCQTFASVTNTHSGAMNGTTTWGYGAKNGWAPGGWCRDLKMFRVSNMSL